MRRLPTHPSMRRGGLYRGTNHRLSWTPRSWRRLGALRGRHHRHARPPRAKHGGAAGSRWPRQPGSWASPSCSSRCCRATNHCNHRRRRRRNRCPNRLHASRLRNRAQPCRRRLRLLHLLHPLRLLRLLRWRRRRPLLRLPPRRCRRRSAANWPAMASRPTWRLQPLQKPACSRQMPGSAASRTCMPPAMTPRQPPSCGRSAPHTQTPIPACQSRCAPGRPR